MKAVILAGGEGSRLRPLTLGIPKPMTPLLGKPVLGHILDLLRRHGVRDVAVTLGYLPQAVTDWFGDGAEYGVRLRYFTEETPLGTAGSVKNCMDFLGEDDFLVVSGDAVCDLDLTELMALHQSRRSAATLALCRREDPLEYGLVCTDQEGRVERFLEKPAWGAVVTDLVNTGVYVLTHRAMDLAPDGPCDFGKELFPALLARGEPMYGYEVPGYWCDMGDCRAYLQCAADALDGKVALELGPQTSPGVWQNSPIPPGVTVRPPCWIGRRVALEPGCTIGPHAALGDGSSLGRGSAVERSVVLGARIGAQARVDGAILCRNAAVHDQAEVDPGAVLGEGAVADRGSQIAAGIKLWPGRRAPAGSKLTASLVSGGAGEPLKFSGGGALTGVVGEELTAEALVLLGSLLGAEGRLGLGHSGGHGAGVLARAAGCGGASAGGGVLMTDAPCPSAAAWLGCYYARPATLVVQQEGAAARLFLTGPDGLPLPRSRQRKLEGGLLRGERERVAAERIGGWESVTGVKSGYAGQAAERAKWYSMPMRPLTVSVPAGTAEDDALSSALWALGCAVERTDVPGAPKFHADHGGFRLTAWDENGALLDGDRLLVLVTLIEYENGSGRAALPSWAPRAAEEIASAFGGGLLRLDRDEPEAGERYRALPWLWDGLFAACRICARMGLTGETLSDLGRAGPKFATVRRESATRRGRGETMRDLLERDPAARSEGEGVRVKVGDGWVYLSPMAGRSALRVIGEAADVETADELCDFYLKKLERLDGEG